MSLSFAELFHKRSLQFLAAEVCKSKHQISAVIVQKRFKAGDCKYNSRKHTLFANRPIRTQKFGIQYLACRPKLKLKSLHY